MTASIKPFEEAAQRKRRGHKKSRLGCRNCKLRRIKCDEARPKCEKCLRFGVSCNYDPNAPDLQASIDTVTEIGSPLRSNCSVTQSILGLMNSSLSLCSKKLSEVYQLNTHDLERLERFQTRTIFTLGTPKSAHIYRNAILPLACSHPHVMHVVMTITAKHDRYLSASPNSKETAVEAYHMYQAASGLNQVLSAPVQPSDRDAIWATAVMLGVLELASADASSPEESWPLKPSSPSDLQWLRVSDGKKVVWKIANPFRPDSIFHNLSDDWEEHFKAVAPAITPSIERLLSQFADLCHLDGLSTAANSPYYSPVHNLANLLPIDCNPTTILSFMCFLSDIDNAFTGLLERKDPRALLLLAYWYAKVCDYHWYIARRATIECKAICIYLEKYYACDGAIQELLHFPKKSCGLISYRDLEDVTESES